MVLTPHCRQITLTTGGQSYNLYTLLSAIDPELPKLAKYVAAQSDPSNGAATVGCGNRSTGGAFLQGASLVASQVWILPAIDAGEYDLNNCWLQGSSNGVLVNVTLTPR